MMAVVALTHALGRRRYVRPQELARETILAYSDREGSAVYLELLQPAGVSPRWQRVQLTEAILELAKAGLGIGLVTRWAAQPQLAAGARHGVRLTPAGFMRHWQAVLHAAQADVRYLADFLDLVRADGPQHVPLGERRPAVVQLVDRPRRPTRRESKTGGA